MVGLVALVLCIVAYSSQIVMFGARSNTSSHMVHVAKLFIQEDIDLRNAVYINIDVDFLVHYL